MLQESFFPQEQCVPLDLFRNNLDPFSLFRPDRFEDNPPACSPKVSILVHDVKKPFKTTYVTD
jgi:hypothetical protein